MRGRLRFRSWPAALAAALATALLALTSAAVTVAAPAPAGAETFGGWSYQVEVNATRFDGLALNQVNWNGTRILERISLPAMNVFYQDNACGPYVDRLGGAAYTGPFGQDFVQNGVRWRSIGLTDQIGNYTITMVYYLSENGELDAHMFSKGVQCNVNHEHYPYWRMDFDLAGAANDEVVYSGPGGPVTRTTEFSLPATTAAGHQWAVRDRNTGRRVSVAFDDGSFTLPGTVIPEQQYAANMVYGRQYQLSEEAWTGGATRSSVYGDNGQTMTDLVLWYSGHMAHSAAEGPDLWHSTGVRLQVDPPAAATALSGRVVDASGAAVSGVAVGHFTQDGNGLRAQWLGDATTDASGNYRFPVTAPGCYTMVATAPAGRSFVGGSPYAERPVCVAAGQTAAASDAVLVAANGAGPALGDRVTNLDGTPAAGVQADLFAAGGDGLRAGYLGSTATDAAGTYRFAVAPGCYVVVFVAPSGRTFTNGSPYRELSRCVGSGQVDNTVDAVLAGGPGAATIGDRVTRAATGAGVAGVQVDLFQAGGDGLRAQYLGSTATDGTGLYHFSPAAGCYVVVFVAPAGQSFVGTGPYREVPLCVTAGQTLSSIDAVLA